MYKIDVFCLFCFNSNEMYCIVMKCIVAFCLIFFPMYCCTNKDVTHTHILYIMTVAVQLFVTRQDWFLVGLRS